MLANQMAGEQMDDDGEDEGEEGELMYDDEDFDPE